MIDHVSIAVVDLAASDRFYTALLAEIGYARLIAKPGTVGFGKRYADFWLNRRPDAERSCRDDGFHVCLRAPSKAAVDAFHARALELGARSDGAPGWRPEYTADYYAAFVLDPDGNRIEVVTFLAPPAA